MIDNLEALVALAECGTMSRAALRLSITQSAVSKRIANLQSQLGKPLVERSGRRVELTPYALHILQRTRPLLGELREALSEEVADNTGQLSVAIGAAILIAWGAEVLAKVRRENPGIQLRINTYRGPEAIERVRSGEYMVGICFGRSENTPDLEARYIVDETIVIVPSDLRRFEFPVSGELRVLTTAPQSETWRFIERQLQSGERQWGVHIHVENTMESFQSVTQMARVGFGHGLVTLGVARAFGVPMEKLVRFPDPGLSIPISLCGRRSTLARPLVQTFLDSLKRNLPEHN
jgi:DNA-binding transcriptional LysR family regulator